MNSTTIVEVPSRTKTSSGAAAATAKSSSLKGINNNTRDSRLDAAASNRVSCLGKESVARSVAVFSTAAAHGKKAADSSRTSKGISTMEDSDSVLETLLVAEDVIGQSNDHLSLLENNSFLRIVAWREKIAQWFYDVVDYMNEPRATVFVAMNILDRYSAVRLQNEDIVVGQTYKIAAMTAIFLAIRIAGSGDLRINDLIRASRGNFGVQDVISTGRSMIDVLTWGIRIVTPHDFIDAILQCLPSSITDTAKASLREAASYVVELSVYDAFFARLSASKVAVAALLHSIEGTSGSADSVFTNSDRSAFHDVLHKVKHTRESSADITSIKSRLHCLYSRVEMEDTSQEKSLHYISDEELDSDEEDRNNTKEHIMQQKNQTLRQKALAAIASAEAIGKENLSTADERSNTTGTSSAGFHSSPRKRSLSSPSSSSRCIFNNNDSTQPVEKRVRRATAADNANV